MNLWTLVAGFLLFLGVCKAEIGEPNLHSRTLSIADIPPCGLQCMFLTVPASGCSLDDLNCVCNNERLAQTLAACMLANCTMSDTLGAVKVQSDLCGFSQESKRMDMFVYTGIMYGLAIVLVVLRISGKILAKNFALDDCVVVAALVLVSLPVGCVFAMTQIGFGEHLWNLEDGELLRILRLFYICSSFYVLALALIKLSLLFFYIEIFRTRQFRIAAHVVLIYIVVNSLVIFFLTIFSCMPLSAFWNRDKKGKCLDVQALAYANSASAIVQDIMLLVLPLFSIQRLQMKRYRKIAVGLMFSIGTFGCIATIVRLRTLLGFKMSIDPTWDYVPVTIWTELELLAGFACVSLPSIRILIVRVLPRGIKDFLSHVTRSSRSRSNTASNPSQQREWKKPASWINMSRDAKDSAIRSSSGQEMSSLWTRNSRSPSTDHHVRTGANGLESALSNYSEFDDVITRPHFPDKRLDLGYQQSESLNVPNPKRATARQSLWSHSSRDSRITALPPIRNIGCLPEGSFSDLEIPKKTFKGLGRKWIKDSQV